MSSRDELRRRNIQNAHNTEAHVAWRVNGHAFLMVGGSNINRAVCLGCGVTVSGWSPSSTSESVVAEKASRALPPCTQPWNLKERLREIDEKYARTGRSGEEGGEITLESVNAKLDRIIQHLRIR